MGKQFIEHRPGYFTGWENATYEVKDFKEVLDIPFVKNFSERTGFYKYAVDVEIKPEYRMSLLALYNWDEEYNGCTSWWCVGHLPGFIMYETDLKKYHNQTASHKPNCWARKYKSCADLLDYDRTEATKIKVLKELGWPTEDMFGVAQYCDCGLKK